MNNNVNTVRYYRGNHNNKPHGYAIAPSHSLVKHTTRTIVCGTRSALIRPICLTVMLTWCSMLNRGHSFRGNY